ncbi:MAG TPA: serine hydrolase domain-containing protein, partial [Gammaproteobacteria bacterium]|nr:serine hydrolase domain-containing protein [Gammaproteobacteria bacterium]
TLFAALAVAAVATAAPDPLPRARPEQVGMSAQRLANLTPVLKSYVDSQQVAGSVALVARRGKLVYFEAFGQADREARVPMQTDSIFRIASQSKAIVTTAAMMLVEQGKLGLNDPVAKYIPEFAKATVAVPKDGGGYYTAQLKRPITVRDLMTHTSGLSYGTGPAADLWQKAGITGYYFSDRDEPIGATVARMASLPLDAQPGEKWIYGYSIDVLGAVAERASGLPLDELVRTSILAPLGMNDTAFYLPPEKRGRLTAVYARNGNAPIVRAPNEGAAGQGAYVDGPRKSFSGGAGLLSTAGDYARFLEMMLGGGELDGKRLLSRKTVELMTQDHLHGIPFQPGQGFGLGFSVVKDVGARGEPGSVGEFGWGGAYHSTYWVDPVEKLVVVYLTQLNPAGDVDDFARLRALVYQAIVD